MFSWIGEKDGAHWGSLSQLWNSTCNAWGCVGDIQGLLSVCLPGARYWSACIKSVPGGIFNAGPGGKYDHTCNSPFVLTSHV